MIVKAPAKINLALEVVNKRSDGYHNLRMIMAPIALYDEIKIESLNENVINITSSDPALPTDERNLVYQAAQLMKDRYSITEGFQIHIDKRIPMGAGLGGGSSDAAQIIKAINSMHQLNLSLKDMIEIADLIGSDVPFCLLEQPAIVEGKGEHLTPIQSLPESYIVLVKPKHLHVSTKDIFQHVNLDNLIQPDIKALLQAINENDYTTMVKYLGNALESVTFTLYPEVAHLKQTISQFQPDGVLMSGSGPTIFALSKDEKVTKKILKSFNKQEYDLFLTKVYEKM